MSSPDSPGPAPGPRRRRRGHRTQEERRRETRQKLLDATLECLAVEGYARTSTTEIVRRAGVSRGAQVHHFPTKIDLVTAAVAHLIDLRIEEFRESFRKMPPDISPASAALEIVWPILTGPTFEAWLVLVVAARTRPDLRKVVKSMNKRLEDGFDEIFVEIFPQLTDNTTRQMMSTLTFALLEGLVLRRLIDRDDPKLAVCLAGVRANADEWLDSAARSTPAPLKEAR